jgi:hypothetical protein
MPLAKKTRSKPSAAKKATRSQGDTGLAVDNDGDDSTEESGRSTSMGLSVDDEVLEFIAALDRFKKEHNRNFPSWSEVLHVLKSLGYRRS